MSLYAVEDSFIIDDLMALFSRQFRSSEQTLLVSGDDEPLYLPKSTQCEFHQVIFAHGFFSSAMHELAHWCIAGDARRQLTDYGYWYEPDGRTLDQQLAFAAVEAKPQALEWVFNKACNRRFYISLDNLDGKPGDDLPFKQTVVDALASYRQNGLPARALLLQKALAHFYRQDSQWLNYEFSIQELGV
ncbi:MAG: elongation factor P hydroxylase [Pseudomonadales bacterium]|nr:elongation factor P hydroxylase [Pseudomonadales bacterium]